MDFMSIVIQYGLEIGCVVVTTILLIGCVKVLFRKGLEKISKPNRKPIYETLSIVLSFGLVAAWLAIKPLVGLGEAFDYMAVIKLGGASYAAVKVTYPLYENYRIRDLFKAVGNTIIKLLKRQPTKAMSKSGGKAVDTKKDNDKTIVL